MSFSQKQVTATGSTSDPFKAPMSRESARTLKLKPIIFGYDEDMCALRLKGVSEAFMTLDSGVFTKQSVNFDAARNALSRAYGRELPASDYDIHLRKHFLCAINGQEYYSYYGIMGASDWLGPNGVVTVEVHKSGHTSSPSQTFAKFNREYPIKLQVRCEARVNKGIAHPATPIVFDAPLATLECLTRFRKSLPSFIGNHLKAIDGHTRKVSVFFNAARPFQAGSSSVSDVARFEDEVMSCFRDHRPLLVQYTAELGIIVANGAHSKEGVARQVTADAAASSPKTERSPQCSAQVAPKHDNAMSTRIEAEDTASFRTCLEGQMRELRKELASLKDSVSASHTSEATHGETESKSNNASSQTEGTDSKQHPADVEDTISRNSSTSIGRLSVRDDRTKTCTTQNTSEASEKKETSSTPQTTVHSASCDTCDNVIKGTRYKCLTCPDFDCCIDCKPLMPELHPNHRFVTLSEASLMPEGCQPADWISHPTVVCDGCDTYILGPRFKCVVCKDFDFCSACEADPVSQHGHTDTKPHLFLKIDKPLPRWVKIKNYLPMQESMEKVQRQLEEGVREEKAPGGKEASMPNSVKDAEVIADVLIPTRNDATAECTNDPASTHDMREKDVGVVVDREQPRVDESVSLHKTTVQRHNVIHQSDTAPKTSEAPQSSAAWDEEPAEEYDMEYLSDLSSVDGCEVAVGTTFSKTWRLKNNGRKPWPSGTLLVPICSTSEEETEQSVASASLENETPPGCTVDLMSADLRAPQGLGSWTMFFRLQLPSDDQNLDSAKINFGQQLWCSVNVIEPCKNQLQTSQGQARDNMSGERSESSSTITSKAASAACDREPAVHLKNPESFLKAIEEVWEKAGLAQNGEPLPPQMLRLKRFVEKTRGNQHSKATDRTSQTQEAPRSHPMSDTATDRTSGTVPSNPDHSETDFDIDDALSGYDVSDADSDFEIVEPSSRSSSSDSENDFEGGDDLFATATQS